MAIVRRPSTSTDASPGSSRTATPKSIWLSEIAHLCEKAGKPGDGLGNLEDAVRRAPESSELRTELRKLYGELNAVDQEARMLLDEARRTSDLGVRAEHLFQAAELFFRQGDVDEAADVLAQGMKLDPERLDAAVLRARILVRRGLRSEALDNLHDLADTHHQRRSVAFWLVHRQVAEIHLAEDELVEAMEALSKAHRLNTGDAETALLLGLVALDLDNLELASGALRSYVATTEPSTGGGAHGGPTDLSRAYYHIAWIEHVKGNDTVARSMASRAIEESSQNHKAQRLLHDFGTT